MKPLVVIAFIFCTSLSFAQETPGEAETATSQKTGPVWPGCEKSNNPKTCFNQKLMEHVRAHYEYPKNEDGEYVRGKVTLKIAIDEEGKVVLKSVKAQHPEVKEAATEMVGKMPEMEPASRNGEPREVSYTIPLTL